MKPHAGPLYNVAHPFIASMYIKKEFDSGEWKNGKDILVIETKRNKRPVSKKVREEKLVSFLSDLDLIKTEVERKIGKFSRVDIRYH